MRKKMVKHLISSWLNDIDDFTGEEAFYASSYLTCATGHMNGLSEDELIDMVKAHVKEAYEPYNNDKDDDLVI